MNIPDLPPVPPGSTLTIVAESGVVVITLPRRRTAGVRDLVGFTVLLTFVVVLLLGALSPLFAEDPMQTLRAAGTGYIFWLFFAVLFLVKLGKLLYEREEGGCIFIDASRFAVGTIGLFINRDYIWPREQLGSIAAWQGLRVRSANGRQVILLKERNPTELRYVEEVARLLLDLAPEPVRGPGKLAVTYQGTFWDEPEEGVLHIEPGRLTLAHPLADKPHLKFVASDGWFRHWWFGESITLSPSDLVCRLDEDGNCRLEIAPTEVYGGRSLLGMLPRISIAPLGRVFTLSRDLLDCQVMRLPARNEPLRLVLRCDDPEALPRAVARFWGAAEE